MSVDLLEVARRIDALPMDERSALEKDVMAATGNRVWVPTPGPQLLASQSLADELLYGGEAGGGKSDLICGEAMTNHERSLILRRFTDDAKELAERCIEIGGTRDGYNGADLIYRWHNRVVFFGGCKEEQSKQRYKGKPKDLIGFDELSDFSETIYRFIITWNRSVNPDQRCRVIGATNPPTTTEGLWIVRYWAPWLDPTHPNPAEQGELRWFVTDSDDKDIEVDGPGEYEIEGRSKPVKARSRTFIRSTLEDNPDLAQTDYDSILQNLPGVYRKAYADGRFDLNIEDVPNQIMPTSWVMAAQERWVDYPPYGIPMCNMGVDPSEGGNDPTTIAPRHDGWFGRIIELGKTGPIDGPTIAGQVVTNRRDSCHVTIDMGGGYGGSTYDHLKGQLQRDHLHAYKGAAESRRMSEDGQLKFFNTRTEAHWRFREALDPSKYQASPISLPIDDSELRSDLTTPYFTVERAPGGGSMIKMEPKKSVMKRLGRSTNRGDAVVMSWFYGPKSATHIQEWRPDQRVGNIGRTRKPGVNMGPRRRIVRRKR